MQHTGPDFARARAIAAVLMAATVLVGCRAPSADWTHDTVPEPTIFGEGIISSDERDYDIAFTPDGFEAYFTRRTRRGPSKIRVSRFVDGQWTTPKVAPFAVDRDESPFVSQDGSTMLFASRRNTPGTFDRSENIWMMTKGREGWSNPVPLPGTVNQPRSDIGNFTTGTERGPVLLGNGALLYWTRVDPEWGADLYVADPDEKGAYLDPRPLRINSYGDETNPAMSPDGRYLVFQGYGRAEAYGEQDLYVSERTDYGWTDPTLLPEPINSTLSDGWPSFSPDGQHFFFASDRAQGRGYYDIYYVDIAALGLGDLTTPAVGSPLDASSDDGRRP